jgi:bifunctional non-homologous end joining protein LigD
MTNRVRVNVEGHVLGLSNLDKVLYPASGTTKGEVIDYYTRIAPALLPHLRARALTRKRWPDGVAAESFFEKNIPRGTPEWVRTENLPAPGSTMNRETIDYVVADDLATLVWLANLAVLELHVPQWCVTANGEPELPNRLVVDLDPGEPAGIPECGKVALILANAFEADGLTSYPKTSGSKGLQMYVGLDATTSSDDISRYVRHLAQRLEKEYLDLIVSVMRKDARPGKVFIDWSQNNSAKTTVAPYSLRGRDIPTVSTPVTWDEVDEAAAGHTGLVFGPHDVLDRVSSSGDLLSPLLNDAAHLAD